MAEQRWPECFCLPESEEQSPEKNSEQEEDDDIEDEKEKIGEENTSNQTDNDVCIERRLRMFEAIFRKFDELSRSEAEESVEQLRKSLLCEEDNTQDEDESSEVQKQKRIIKYLEDAIKFTTRVEEAMKIMCQLLGSKTNTDILETIEFFVSAAEFGIANAEKGTRSMLALVWSRDATVKGAVVEAYRRLYIEPKNGSKRNVSLSIVHNLTTLTNGASLGDLTSLEELLKELYSMNVIPQNVIQILWQRFSLKIPQTDASESRAAILLLGMFASSESSIIKSNIDILVNHGLGPRAHDDFLLAMNTCTALLKLGNKTMVGGGDKESFKLPEKHLIFENLETILVKGLERTNVSTWSNLGLQAINVIYHLAEHPDRICARLIKNLVRALLINQSADTGNAKLNGTTMNEGITDTQESEKSQGKSLQESLSIAGLSCCPKILGRVVTIIGHVAFQQLVHLDVRIFGELKRRRRIKEKEKEMEKKDKNHEQTRQSTTNGNKASTSGETTLEDELGVGGAAAEDAEAEFIRGICEKEIVTGHNLLALFGPLIVDICSNPNKYQDKQLRAAACLALSKFMLVSSEFCEPNLQLLFTILEKSKQPIIRANVIIALGDLTFRFPNLIEPWTTHLYDRLTDHSPEVRQATVTILTRLILNDMVKVKGQISAMALCLEDSNKRIADLTRLFFNDFSQKGNSLYNVLPDIISRLSDPSSCIEEAKFKTIMEYLLKFIQKEKQSESLVEKLCHRCRVSVNQRQWHDLAYCLSLLPFNEKCFKKLQENFACFQEMLSDEKVYNCFLGIVSKSKNVVKQEAKIFLEEFEQRLIACHNKGVNDDEDFRKAAKASEKAAKKKNQSTSIPGSVRKKTRTRKNKDDTSNERNEDKENNYKTPHNGNRKKSTRNTARRKASKKPFAFSSDDDDDDDDLFEEN